MDRHDVLSRRRRKNSIVSSREDGPALFAYSCPASAHSGVVPSANATEAGCR